MAVSAIGICCPFCGYNKGTVVAVKLPAGPAGGFLICGLCAGSSMTFPIPGDNPWAAPPRGGGAAVEMAMVDGFEVVHPEGRQAGFCPGCGTPGAVIISAIGEAAVACPACFQRTGGYAWEGAALAAWNRRWNPAPEPVFYDVGKEVGGA